MIRVALLLLICAQLLPQAASALDAGAAAVDISPVVEPFTDTNKNRRRDAGEPYVDTNKNGRWDAVWLAGFALGRAAQSINDPLWARALVLREGETTLAIVGLDLVGVLFHRVSRIKARVAKELGIPGANVIVTASHTHHAPDSIGIWGETIGKTGRNIKYLDRVDEAVFAAIKRAQAALKPATLKVATCQGGDLIGDSREPKVMDPEMLVLQLLGEDARTIATLSVFGCHPEVLGSKNQVVTSDFPHYLRGKLEKQLGGTAVFVAGALGGLIAPRVGRGTFANCEKMGQTLADRAIAALKKVEAEKDTRLRIVTRRVPFVLGNLMFRVALGAGMLPKSDLMVRKKGGRIEIPVDVSAVALGSTTLLGVPGELFPELGFELKKKIAGSGKRAILGLANMELGYIIPPKAWSIRNYEETMSASRTIWPMLERTHTALLAKLGRLKE